MPNPERSNNLQGRLRCVASLSGRRVKMPGFFTTKIKARSERRNYLFHNCFAHNIQQSVCAFPCMCQQLQLCLEMLALDHNLHSLHLGFFSFFFEKDSCSMGLTRGICATPQKKAPMLQEPMLKGPM